MLNGLLSSLFLAGLLIIWVVLFTGCHDLSDQYLCPVLNQSFFPASLIVKEVMFFRELLSDLSYTQVGPTVIRTDN